MDASTAKYSGSFKLESVPTLTATDLPGVELVGRGKVRDVYRAAPNQLLFVATDRISAFDCILPDGIPDKGRVLTQMSLFWFEYLKDLVPNHLVTADVNRFPLHIHPFREQLEGRSMLVKRAEMIQVECVARGYVAGSGWKDYQRTGAICGIPLPAGLKESDRLPQPIFTPATKASHGHDENIPFSSVEELAGPDLAARLRELTLALYAKAAGYALTRGIIIADTKFEFGLYGDQLLLADEVLTPDSSRFWPAADYEPGRAQQSFDKQFVRDYLETTDWNKQPPAPALPPDVILNTAAKYREAYTILTGREL
jgi:phosphoribosylaminoimidazole-succinocarboxamide synthase